MKQTLLQIVQSILSAADSDEVNSISDTAESLQAANCVQQTFWNMMGRYDMPEHNQPFQLTASGDITKPTLMTRPDGVTRIEWIKYYDVNPSDQLQTDQFGAYSQHDVNTDLVASTGLIASSTSTVTITNSGTVNFTILSGLVIPSGELVTAVSGLNSITGTVSSYVGTTLTITATSSIGSGTYSAWNIFQGGPSLGPGYVDVDIIPFDVFMQRNVAMNAADGNVGTMQLAIVNDTSGATQLFNINYMNNFRPQYCCIVSNNYVIFDSYDSTQDSILQSSKSMAFGWVYPTFTLTDSFIPPLDAQQFPLLLNDAKALFFFENKQQPHTKAEEEVGRQLVSLQKWKAIAAREQGNSLYFNELPNFGR